MTRPPNESGGGGMTGATGDLTPDDADRPFIPAELRDISHPEAAEPEAIPADEAERLTGGTTPGESDGDEFSDHDEHF
jgi:hypothetical protein